MWSVIDSKGHKRASTKVETCNEKSAAQKHNTRKRERKAGKGSLGQRTDRSLCRVNKHVPLETVRGSYFQRLVRLRTKHKASNNEEENVPPE